VRSRNILDGHSQRLEEGYLSLILSTNHVSRNQVTELTRNVTWHDQPFGNRYDDVACLRERAASGINEGPRACDQLTIHLSVSGTASADRTNVGSIADPLVEEHGQVRRGREDDHIRTVGCLTR
jgi:hypothetical protein